MPRIRRGRRKKPSSHVGGLGSKASSRSRVGKLGSKATSRSRVGGLGSKASPRSHVGSLGSKAGSRSRTLRRSSGSTSQPFRPQTYRIRRPRYRRPYGYAYPRRYRARPMSSCGCFTVFIIIAILWLIYLAPSIIIGMDTTLSLVLPIVVVVVLFFVAIGFITKLVDDDDDETRSDEEQVRVIEHEKVLVVCPYCGAKNEQGVTTCKNCDAEI